MLFVCCFIDFILTVDKVFTSVIVAVRIVVYAVHAFNMYFVE
jgi:hypothetical protein